MQDLFSNWLCHAYDPQNDSPTCGLPALYKEAVLEYRPSQPLPTWEVAKMHEQRSEPSAKDLRAQRSPTSVKESQSTSDIVRFYGGNTAP